MILLSYFWTGMVNKEKNNTNYSHKNTICYNQNVLVEMLLEFFLAIIKSFFTENSYPGVMRPGMTFTIEPALTQGTEEVEILEDQWTVVTVDNARSAQSEHTVLITTKGVEILTV